jgi:hypothetical protein
MNRTEALNFIRDNSRQVCRMLGNPVPKEDQGDWYEPCYFEQRLGMNGTPFVLQDMGKHGWEIYFIQPGNLVDLSMKSFAEITGVILPEQ